MAAVLVCLPETELLPATTMSPHPHGALPHGDTAVLDRLAEQIADERDQRLDLVLRPHRQSAGGELHDADPIVVGAHQQCGAGNRDGRLRYGPPRSSAVPGVNVVLYGYCACIRRADDQVAGARSATGGRLGQIWSKPLRREPPKGPRSHSAAINGTPDQDTFHVRSSMA